MALETAYRLPKGHRWHGLFWGAMIEQIPKHEAQIWKTDLHAEERFLAQANVVSLAHQLAELKRQADEYERNANVVKAQYEATAARLRAEAEKLEKLEKSGL
jgi:hypothetical protein